MRCPVRPFIVNLYDCHTGRMTVIRTGVPLDRQAGEGLICLRIGLTPYKHQTRPPVSVDGSGGSCHFLPSVLDSVLDQD